MSGFCVHFKVDATNNVIYRVLYLQTERTGSVDQKICISTDLFFSLNILISPSVFFFFFDLLLPVYVSDQELERFKAFVKKRPAFDVVVDGLNVANQHRDKGNLSETVRQWLSSL